MKNTGRHSEKSGYLVILLLVVGLTAFSHSMKELTEIHQLTVDASRVVAQWSGNFTPAEIPQIPQAPQVAVKIEKLKRSCQNKQSAPSVELSWLNETPEPPTTPSVVAPGRKQIRIKRTTRSVAGLPSEAEIAAKLKKLQRIDIDTDAFEVRVPSVQFPEAGESGSVEIPEFTFRAKARKPGASKINPRDREILLKTLNRSINLRIAS
jgi:hypothetical protein